MDTSKTELMIAEYERDIIGKLIYTKDFTDEFENVRSVGLTSADFANKSAAKIFSIIERNAGSGLSPTDTLMQEIIGTEHEKYYLECRRPDNKVNTLHIAEYARKVHYFGLRRALVRKMEDSVTKLYDDSRADSDPVELFNIMNDMRREINELQNKQVLKISGVRDSYRSTLEKLIEQRANPDKGSIKTGTRIYDEYCNGVHGGELVIISARPGCCKTALAMNWTLNFARNGLKGVFLSLEMSEDSINHRIMANVSGVPLSNITHATFSDDELKELERAQAVINGYDIIIPTLTRYIEDIDNKLQIIADEGRLNYLVIVYLTLLDTRQRSFSQQQQIGYLSRWAKLTALRYNIPVIALAQQNRGDEKELPTLQRLRGSGDIEQDADVVLSLFPITMANRDSLPSDAQKMSGYAQIESAIGKGYSPVWCHILKNRQGRNGADIIFFNGSKMRFTRHGKS